MRHKHTLEDRIGIIEGLITKSDMTLIERIQDMEYEALIAREEARMLKERLTHVERELIEKDLIRELRRDGDAHILRVIRENHFAAIYNRKELKELIKQIENR